MAFNVDGSTAKSLPDRFARGLILPDRQVRTQGVAKQIWHEERAFSFTRRIFPFGFGLGREGKLPTSDRGKDLYSCSLVVCWFLRQGFWPENLRANPQIECFPVEGHWFCFLMTTDFPERWEVLRLKLPRRCFCLLGQHGHLFLQSHEPVSGMIRVR